MEVSVLILMVVLWLCNRMPLQNLHIEAFYKITNSYSSKVYQGCDKGRLGEVEGLRILAKHV